MALEDGPLRRILKEGILKRGFSSPQEPYEKLTKDVMSLTGLSERNAMIFVKSVGSDPYLYVFYDLYGKAVDWDFCSSEEEVAHKVRDRFPRMPEFKGYKIFKASVRLEEIERRGIP